MRVSPLVFAVGLSFQATGVYAGDKGVPPRARPSDYQAQQSVKDTGVDATLAAAIVPARQIEKLFSTDIAKQYVVIEMAVYPTNGRPFDVDWFNFGLKVGDAVAHVEKPRDVATPWPAKGPVPNNPVTVTTTTGVVIGRTSDSVNGPRTVRGVYQDVSVTNDPRAAPPPPPQKPGVDPSVVEQRIHEKMLPEGPSSTTVAGYLFFPRMPKRPKGGVMELQWNRNAASAVLRLQEK